MRIELPFEGNTPYSSVVSSVRNMTLGQSSYIQEKGRSNVPLGRKPSKLEAGGSSTLHPYEN
jgi:hypothetical protein